MDRVSVRPMKLLWSVQGQGDINILTKAGSHSVYSLSLKLPIRYV